MVAANNGIYNTVGASISGVTNTFTVTNPSNTAASAARETITVGGGTSGDPTLNFNINGVTNWEQGIDNSDADKYKLSLGTALGTTDTIVAFTTGQVLQPRQPAFLAVISATQSNVTGDGTSYTVIFDTERQDIGSNYDNTTGIFTAPVTGTYVFVTSLNITGINAAHTGGAVDTIINNAAAGTYHGTGGNPFNQSNSLGQLDWTANLIVPMTAGDTARITILIQGGTKTINIIGTTATTAPVTYFSGFLLG